MQKSDISFADRGDPTTLVFDIPGEISRTGQQVQSFALPLLSRQGGLLVALPLHAIQESALMTASLEEDDGLLGPSHEFSADLIVEDDTGGEVSLGVRRDFIVVDVADSALAMMREYDPVTDSTEEILGFSADRADSLVAVGDVLQDVTSWLENVVGEQGRLNFYSAREEPENPAPAAKAPKKVTKKVTTAQLAEQMAMMLSQIQAISAQQDALAKAQTGGVSATPAAALLGATTAPKLPSLSAGYAELPAGSVQKALSLVGPPPRTKVAIEPKAASGVEKAEPGTSPGLGTVETSSMVAAISQQSAALTTLVAHLASGDALTDLQGSSSSSSVSTKGVARRERMQQDLANRSSQYFLQVQQQIFKKLHPSKVCPKTEEELMKSDVSMTSYLEKHGAFRGQKEYGMIMWMLAHAMDSAAQGDFFATKEFLALLCASMDQAVLDGHWNIGYLIGLLEEPPGQMFADRPQSSTSLGKPFAALVPPQWAAVSLSYIKEIDLLASKKNEQKRTTPKAEGDPPSSPSPRRRPRFPKKPKAGDPAKPNNA